MLLAKSCITDDLNLKVLQLHDLEQLRKLIYYRKLTHPFFHEFHSNQVDGPCSYDF